jgi:hypothetical protein
MLLRACCTVVAIALVSLDGGADRLFSSQTPVELTLAAPLQQLFDNGKTNEDYTVPGVVSYHSGSFQVVKIPDVEVSIRGNTSKRESECPFPKLKLKFKDGSAPKDSIFDGVDTLRIGTHCGESEGEALTRKYGRLANEKSPWREALVYRLLSAVGVPTLLARPARITYIDAARSGHPLVRNAMLLEDDDAAKKRLGAKDEIVMDDFTTAAERFRVADAARLAFGEALAGNFDWCLKFTATDTYRCDERKPLWNVLAFARDGSAFPVPQDFDLSGIVTGRHLWFVDVYNPAFVESSSPIDVEVLGQVQRTRTLFTRDVLDATRREFMDHRGAAEQAIADAAVDPHGRELARHYAESFFGAIGSDAAFYRPVVGSPNTRVYVDAAKSREACGRGETVPVGTPVAERRRSGEMAEVVLLDIMWQWAPPNACEAIHKGTVWIDASAIGSSRPTADHEDREDHKDKRN